MHSNRRVDVMISGTADESWEAAESGRPSPIRGDVIVSTVASEPRVLLAAAAVASDEILGRDVCSSSSTAEKVWVGGVATAL